MEQTQEDWHLHQHWQAGSQRVYAHLLLQLTHLDRECLAVVLVLALQLLHFWLHFLHLAAGT